MRGSLLVDQGVVLAEDPGSKVRGLARYLRRETTGGIILLGATALALIVANSPLGDNYQAFRSTRLGISLLHLDLTVGEWTQDGLLALFFFVAGAELKRELVVGQLASRKSASLPVIAAIGGMVLPALLTLAIGIGQPGVERAWAIPVATDIAFALGVLALTGSALPPSARIFLLSLAVVDDLGAILVIALVFSGAIDVIALLVAVVLLAGYWYLQHRRIRSPWIYVPLCLAIWIAIHASGVHATIAGVALGLLTRVKRDPGEQVAPAVRLEHRLQPWSAGVAVPLFALSAAGISVGAKALSAAATDRLAIAIAAGLIIGKVVGIFGSAFLALKLRLAALPSGLGRRDLLAVAMLGGVGFTVSLLMAELALSAPAVDHAKAAVLFASAVAALLGAGCLLRRNRVHRRRSSGR